jgi:hypothetical protein
LPALFKKLKIMALPKIIIEYANGALGTAVASSDGLMAICVCGAAAVSTTFAHGKPYSLRKLDDLAALGVTEANNKLLYKTAADFYQQAQEGTKVYVVGYPGTLSMSQALDKTSPYLREIVKQTNGEIRGIIVTKVSIGAEQVNGLTPDIPQALLKAQQLAEWAAEVKYAPIFILLDGLDFDGNPTELVDLKQQNYNRVGVVIGATSSDTPNQAVGLIAGKIASTSVDTNIGRVADGALNVIDMFVGGSRVELADVETVHDAGYITFRTFVGKAGYFIADDILVAAETDDYRTITARRTIDKAYRIAYGVVLERLLDKVPTTSDGKFLADSATAWESLVENAIAINMTANDELSDNDGDRGVKCTIDKEWNVLATSTVKADLRIRPFGYARFINVTLGFTVNG